MKTKDYLVEVNHNQEKKELGKENQSKNRQIFSLVIFITDMNKQDKQGLELIMYRLDESDKRVDELHQEFKGNLTELHTDIKFIKENLFNPNEGLWAETKLNSQHRVDTKKWRGVIGTGFIGLLFKHIFDMFAK